MLVKDLLELMRLSEIVIINENDDDITMQVCEVPEETKNKKIRTITYDVIDKTNVEPDTGAKIPNITIGDDKLVCTLIMI